MQINDRRRLLIKNPGYSFIQNSFTGVKNGKRSWQYKANIVCIKNIIRHVIIEIKQNKNRVFKYNNTLR